TPPHNTPGLLASTPIKITFSEAMDTTSVENAFSVSNVASSGLSFGWASASTVLTVTANAGWSYATGTSSALAALKYTATLTAAAKDAQGTALGAPLSYVFSTRRRITHTIASETVGSYSTYGHAVGDDPFMCTSATGTTYVSKWTSQASGGTYYTFITFDVSALGAAGATNTIESATFRSTQLAPTGAFYTSHQVTAAKLAYRAIDDTVLDALVTTDLGVFCQSANTLQPSANVLSSFKADFDTGNKKHLFRLAPNLGTADSTYAHFACGGFTLDVTQLVQ
ncbi:MAG TPA: Ig-like domain-containing protein, partial [Polyangiaceae bacterium]|nr:Ig-like domain-containing protein [Polyangiaceae bacterium]